MADETSQSATASKSDKDAKLKSQSKDKLPEFHNPWRVGTLIGDAFELCRKGTTRSKLEKLCATGGRTGEGSPYSRIHYYMRLGAHKGAKWACDYDKESGTIKITPRVPKSAKKSKVSKAA